MAEAGLPVLTPINPPEEPPLPPLPDAAALERRAQAYLGFLYAPLRDADHPDALIALNDINAAPIAVACRMLGRQVHDAVAVAGFDGNWDTDWQWRLAGLAPFLSVRKGNHAVGRALAEMLQERAANRTAPPLQRCMPTTVVRPG
jgi:DNA-binding LacI/PurR family transcriptional regulator